jgi:class 3 adenylate cyclase
MFVMPWFSNLDLLESLPAVRRSLERYGSFASLIVYDRRGSGLSDRLCGTATLEEGMDDLIAVLDDAGAERVSLFGLNESGALCALMAATHPDRVTSLVLYGTYATTTWHPDYPWGQKPEDRDMQVGWICENWGTDEVAEVMFAGTDERTKRWGVSWTRSSVSRDALPKAFEILSRTDVRHVLPSIRVPTLVMHRVGDVAIPVANGHYLAERIPGAKLVELPGEVHFPFFGDTDPLHDEIESFLTGQPPARSTQRVLATILFADIVGSTEKAAEVGDARWRQILDEWDEVAGSEVARAGGTLIKTIGDGILATFDGPARGIRCARTISREARAMDLMIRAGLHTGEIETRGDDIGGLAVHICERVMRLAAPGEVLVSGAVPPLVAGAGLSFEARGEHDLKGIEGRWQIHAVRG